jgi:hypothetical protein
VAGAGVPIKLTGVEPVDILETEVITGAPIMELDLMVLEVVAAAAARLKPIDLLLGTRSRGILNTLLM